MDDVSPELALVDDALAARERGRLPEPDDCLASRPDGATASLPPTLTLLAPPEPKHAEIEPEVPSLPATESEPGVAGRPRHPMLALAESPADPASPSPDISSPDEQAALVELEPSAEPADPVGPGPTETDLDVAEPDAKKALPAVEDAEPRSEELESAPPEEPAAAVPTRMPEWVASDATRKGRRARRRDGGRAGRERPRVRWRRVAVVASWIVLCGFLASPLLAFFPSSNDERPTLGAAPDGVELVPDAGDDGGRTLTWDPVPKAAGYSVVFVNDGVRSDRWSQTADLQLPAGTESEQLVTYEWSVYPAFRDGAGYRYGPLVASGEVTMPMLAPTESS